MVGIGSGLSLAEHSHPELKDSADKVRTKVAAQLLSQNKSRTFLTDLVRHFVAVITRIVQSFMQNCNQEFARCRAPSRQHFASEHQRCKLVARVLAGRRQPQFGDDQDK